MDAPYTSMYDSDHFPKPLTLNPKPHLDRGVWKGCFAPLPALADRPSLHFTRTFRNGTDASQKLIQPDFRLTGLYQKGGYLLKNRKHIRKIQRNRKSTDLERNIWVSLFWGVVWWRLRCQNGYASQEWRYLVCQLVDEDSQTIYQTLQWIAYLSHIRKWVITLNIRSIYKKTGQQIES